MSREKEHVFGVTLQRRDRNTPWGIRIVGGADLGTPIIVTRAQAGSPAEAHLIRGDVIKKIGDYDARDIRHQDALNLFLNAGNAIKLDILRDPRVHIRSNSALDNPVRTPTGSRPQSALSNVASRPSTPGLRAHTPVYPSSPKTIVFPPPNPYQTEEYEDQLEGAYYYNDASADIENLNNQPYRTTPLVLPGAKAKHEKELAPTESYLRHHPNPMMRAPPPHYEFLPQDVLMKQKVADTVLQRVVGDEALAGKQVVHKQFNSPIGLYSDQNIVDTIHHQTGVPSPSFPRNSTLGRPAGRSIGPKKTIVYDPAKSETFKALQEEQYGDQTIQEVTVPAQPKVFTPNIQATKKVVHQPPQTHTYDPLARSSVSPNLQHHLPYVNSMGHSEEQIAQSGSFKRLMNMVMGESDF